MVYRAYRVPYEWVPQAGPQQETSIAPIDVSTFRVPGASVGEGTGKVTSIDGVKATNKLITGTSVNTSEDGPVNFCIVDLPTKK